MDRTLPVSARLMRVNHRRIQYGTRIGNHRHLHSGSNTRIQTYHAFVASRSSKKKILQIGTENTDGFRFGAFAKASKQIAFNGSQALDAPAPAHNACQPNVGRSS